MSMQGSVSIAFALTAFAGLSTGLGALVVFFTRRPKLTMLAFGLGFSSGVMVYISLVELLPLAMQSFSENLEPGSAWIAVACFFGGIAISAIIDRLVPEPSNPHEVVALEDVHRASAGRSGFSSPDDSHRDDSHRSKSLSRLGLLSAVAIGVHNFPEGMATFASAIQDVSLGTSIAVAVAIHNIPEGVAVAVPVFFATGSRGKALLYSFASGLAEPIGALIVYLALMPLLEANPLVIDGMLAAVGGIMVFISFDELLPTSHEYGSGHASILGLILGMAVMAISLLLL
ncbi:MAG: zinc transporter ZupT [Polyangia bacterium]